MPVIKVDTEFQFRLRFRPKLELEIRPLVRLWPNACLQFRPRFQLRPKPAKSVSVGLHLKPEYLPSGASGEDLNAATESAMPTS